MKLNTGAHGYSSDGHNPSPPQGGEAHRLDDFELATQGRIRIGPHTLEVVGRQPFTESRQVVRPVLGRIAFTFVNEAAGFVGAVSATAPAPDNPSGPSQMM